MRGQALERFPTGGDGLEVVSGSGGFAGPLGFLSLKKREDVAGKRSRAWMVAGTVGVVEALKDQGVARWNTTIRTIHHHAKSNLRSIAQAKILTSPAAMASSKDMEEKAKQSEESLRKVMYLSCWGPN
ncbi:unnamed protein product [Lactuca saligna]|uniref:Wound-responsive family protein n=1 Tax=Lactuca saligna TaxID=75948 RepID=A0AA35YKB5_LACSI|nr:unnamed protein product [Lactuca saligna]